MGFLHYLKDGGKKYVTEREIDRKTEGQGGL